MIMGFSESLSLWVEEFLSKHTTFLGTPPVVSTRKFDVSSSIKVPGRFQKHEAGEGWAQNSWFEGRGGVSGGQS
jgi:hypothetical protein